MTNEILSKRPKYTRFQSKTSRKSLKTAEKTRIERDGGRFGAGIIRSASLITRGEALGHGFWVDATFLEQVQSSLSDKESVKSRFTHPGLSSDGLGKVVGRAFDVGKDAIQGDQLFADIEFLECSHNTPDGDLGGYLMDLADEDDSSLAISIVFEMHYGQVDEFVGKHSDEDGEFTSPDPDNKKNLPHARLADLRAADFVDDPAANPGGLFHRSQEIAEDADKLAAFALGLSDQPPAMTALDVDPDRAQAFLAKFLDRHGLEIRKVTKSQPESKPEFSEETNSRIREVMDRAATLLKG